MAKINHNNSSDTLDELLTDAKNKGILHLYTDVDKTTERKLKIAGKELLNFGTCGYLGLELDQRLKDGAIEMLQKFGTQFSVSRTYLTSGIHGQLEDYLSQMYDNSPVITFSSTSSAHISIIPTLVNYDDAVILDQQVHMSIQTAVQLLRQKGVTIEKIRHSNLEMLETSIQELSKKHEKVWYMIDGVYSMFGDLPPLDALIALMAKYKKLHLYIDDAHGMGWYGKNGTGYAYSKIAKHPKVILVTTLAKGFGVVGGLAIFPDEKTKHKVSIFGGPLGYSHPLSPALIGAAIAAAKIMISNEIDVLQNELRQNMDYSNELLSKTNLIVVSNPLTPINCVGMGQPKVAYNMIKRLLNDGFFVNAALFPAVPIKRTGIRFTITRHIHKEDIKVLVDAMVHHYPLVLEEEGITEQHVKDAFDIKPDTVITLPSNVISVNTDTNRHQLEIEEHTSITDVNKEEWDKLLGDNGSFDWDGLLSLEEVFKNNTKPEENWKFYYFIIRDANKQPVLATFFTSTIIKDDMLALEEISLQIEEKRKYEPYCLTSNTLTMGSLLTEGQHYYVNKQHPQWKQAFTLLLDKLNTLQETTYVNTVLLRDFDKEDTELKELFIKEGFASINMPNTNVIEGMTWSTPDELLANSSRNNRASLRKDVFNHLNKFDIEYKNTLTNEEASHFYELYKNVNKKNRAFNMYPYPKNILSKLSKNSKWEFVVLTLKPGYDDRKERKPVAVAWCYNTGKHCSYMIIGIDYHYNQEHKVYKQATYQVLKRAKMLGYSKVYMGLSADFEKQKFGAVQHARVAYMQAKDTFHAEVLEAMSADFATELVPA
jgi:7-keto-8-aminopelargonate synthetase-like enzyme